MESQFRRQISNQGDRAPSRQEKDHVSSNSAGIRGPGRTAGRGRRQWKAPAIALTVLGLAAQSGLTALPAGATLSGPGVSAGKNITVFHNIDMVAVFGYGTVGQSITVDVLRGTTKIGTATGPAVLTDEGPGLEVSHQRGEGRRGQHPRRHVVDFQNAELSKVGRALPGLAQSQE